MRKALGLMFAASLLVSVTAIATSPAGAANTVLPKCKSISGTQTYTPGLPPTSSTKTVKPVTKTVFNDHRVHRWRHHQRLEFGQRQGHRRPRTARCSSPNVGKAAKPTIGTIKWSNGQTSTTSTVLTVTGVERNRADGQAGVEVHRGPRQGSHVDGARPRDPEQGMVLDGTALQGDLQEHEDHVEVVPRFRAESSIGTPPQGGVPFRV